MWSFFQPFFGGLIFQNYRDTPTSREKTVNLQETLRGAMLVTHATASHMQMLSKLGKKISPKNRKDNYSEKNTGEKNTQK